MNRSGYMLFAAVCLCAVVSHAGAGFPLRDMAVSDSMELSGAWQFRQDPADAGVAQSWFMPGADRTGWTEARVPGVWGWDSGPGRLPVYTGVAWYCRRVAIPANWTGAVSVVFLGAMFAADVWVNGEYVGVHRGGYAPFALGVPAAACSPGQEADLVVRVDNRLRDNTAPAKKVGWQPYGGLYREVFLVHQPAVRPEGVFVRTELGADGAALVRVSGTLTNGTASAYEGELALRLAAGQQTVASQQLALAVEAGGGAPFEAGLAVKNARLWSPADPYLHTLRVTWPWQGAQPLEFEVGLREVRVTGSRVLVNNRELWLQGFGAHEEYDQAGPCIPEPVRRAELVRMKTDYGCNTLRPGHYVNHPALYTLCDELGFLVFSEIPLWQLQSQHIVSQETWATWIEPQLRDMVVGLRNHACVAFWGIANELPHREEPDLENQRRYFTKALAYVQGLDPTRPATPVCASTRSLFAYDLVAMGARNLHYGWYHSPRVYGVRDGLAENLRAAGGKPILVAELGAHASAGRLTGGYGDPARGSETYQDKVIRFGYQYCATQSDTIPGILIWTWSDFHRQARLCPHGIFSEARRPKLAAYTVRNLFEGDIRVFVCEEDVRCAPGGTWRADLYAFNPRRRPWPRLNARWCILDGAERVAEGALAAEVAGARAQRIGEVAWPIPGSARHGLYVFWVQLLDGAGKWLHTNSSPFDVGTPSRPGILTASARAGGEPIPNAWMSLAGVRVPVYPFPGLLLPLRQGAYELEFHADGFAPQRRSVQMHDGLPASVVVEFGGEGK
ncbi:MAG: hypothetical protein JXR37_20530 [Kiritimatiellae bacterium]|nr:hypothetical protein [Kiritimatiellia bacterium]